jgi:hypothetical protein
MMGKVSIALLCLVAVAVAAFCLSAQVQPDKKTQQYQNARGEYENLLSKYQSSNGLYVTGNGVKVPVTLCTGPVMGTDGTAKCLYQALPASGKLRIQIQDGSIQEIDLKKIRLITVE